MVAPALVKGQRLIVDKIYCICGGIEVGSKNSIGDKIVSEGGRERERGGATVMETVGEQGEGWRERYRQGKCPRFTLLESETKSQSTAVRCVTDKTVNRVTNSIRGYIPAKTRATGFWEIWLKRTSWLFCFLKKAEESG